MINPRHIPVPRGHLDTYAAIAVLDGETVRLSPVEASVLSVLAERPHESVSEEELLTRAWGYRTTNTRTVSMTLSRLRKKIEVNPQSPQVLLTVRGVGYRLVPAAAPPVVSPPAAPALHLNGRDADLARIRAMLEQHPVVELVGLGGVGKSLLARAALPDAVMVDFSDVREREAMLRRMASGLKTPGSDGLAAVKAALRARPTMILNSAEQLDEASRALLQELLSGVRALVTSREPTGLGRPFVLQGLSQGDAVDLVNDAREGAGLAAVAASVIAPLWQAVGGHPMSLVLAAPLLDFGLAPDQLLLTPGRASHNPLARVQSSVDAMPAPLRSLLDAIAAFVCAPIEGACAVSGLDTPSVLHGVHELRVRGLVAMHEGVVEPHDIVRWLGCSEASRARHAAWIAAQPLHPTGLRGIRRDIEEALRHAHGEQLTAVLLRHLVVILTYGPTDALLDEVSPLLARLPHDGRRDVLWGMALFQVGSVEAAAEALLTGCTALVSSDIDRRADWLALGWTHLSFCTASSRDMALSAQADAQLAALSPLVQDATIAVLSRCTWAINTAATDRAASLRAFREIESAPDSPLEWRLLAAMSRLRLEAPTRAEVLHVALLLDQLGPERLGMEALAQRWIHVGQFWLVAGDTERALEVVRRWAPVYASLSPRLASLHVAHAAMYALAQPTVARELLALAPPDHATVRLTEWLLAPEGTPPTSDEELTALALAYAQGTPVPESERYLRISMALRFAQGRG